MMICGCLGVVFDKFFTFKNRGEFEAVKWFFESANHRKTIYFFSQIK